MIHNLLEGSNLHNKKRTKTVKINMFSKKDAVVILCQRDDMIQNSTL